ncbi:MAG TPA: hypothetical protein VH951_00295 [Dehalococcoidia bacterium]
MQQAQQGTQNTFGGGAGVLNYIGGALPADTLNLAAQGRAAYLNSLPVQAQQIASNTLSQIQNQYNQALSDLLSKKASDTLTAQNDLGAYVQKNQALKQNQAIADATFGLNQARAATSASQAQQRIGISRQNAATSRLNAKTSRQRAATSAAQAQERISISQRALRDREQALARKQAAGGFTSSQIAKFKAVAYDTALDARHGFTTQVRVVDPNSGQLVWKTQTVRPKTYQQAYADLINHGVPPRIAKVALREAGYPKRRPPVHVKSRNGLGVQASVPGTAGY